MITIDEIQPGYTLRGDVAIVASSAILLDSTYGIEIDKYANVIRFNQAPTKGFEVFVGSKTTARTINSGVLANKKASYVGDGKFLENQKDIDIIAFSPKTSFDLNKKNIHNSCKIFHVDSSKRIPINSKIGYPSKKQPTIGTLTIGLCVAYDLIPHLYGYDLEENVSRSHYWENSTKTIVQKHHNFSAEKSYMKKLINAGKVIYHK